MTSAVDLPTLPCANCGAGVPVRVVDKGAAEALVCDRCWPARRDSQPTSREHAPSRAVPPQPYDSIDRDERDELRADAIARTLARVIPARYRAAQISDPRVRDWTAATIRGGTRSLLLLGPTGTGKSHHAYAALSQLIHAGQTGPRIIAGSAPTLLAAARPDGEGDTAIARYARADLLLLDDLGSSKGSEWVDEALYRVIDGRYLECRPLIATSNIPPRQLTQSLGDRLASRLTEMCERVVLKGADRRRSA